MARSPKFTLIVLAAISLLAAAALFVNSRRATHEIAPSGSSVPLPESSQIPDVDQSCLQTARQLTPLATTPEEQELAQEATRLADHEVDLAFSSALRVANNEPARETPETRAIMDRLHQADAAIEAGQNRIKDLTSAAKTAKFDRQQELQQEIQLAQAELQLEQDEAADARQDLVRAGGDARGSLQQALQEHEAGEHENGSVRINKGSNGSTEAPSDNLLSQWHAWSTLGAKQDLLRDAQKNATAQMEDLTRAHDTLEAHAQNETPASDLTQAPAVTGSAAGQPSAPAPASKTTAMVVSLHHLSDDKKNLADLDKRIEDLKQLGVTYSHWESLIKNQRTAIEKGLLNSILWIVLAILLVLICRALIDMFLARLALERKQQLTLRALLRFGLEAVALIAILLVVFGVPSQLSTILGLAGAGLTVVLKDFIVSFLGWFVLMGRNGIRVGDWVEINGVRGEVIEIGLLRTVLLETGNWTDVGQPTGRQVAFLNSYAVEGYYFNFTTSGQWLWDEIQVLIPAGENPYPLIEKVHAIVAKETEGNVQLAEQEWQRVTRRYGLRAPSPLAAVDVKPTASGVQITVRYMVRATERSAVRSRLNHAVVELLHGGQNGSTLPEPVSASSASS